MKQEQFVFWKKWRKLEENKNELKINVGCVCKAHPLNKRRNKKPKRNEL